MVRRLVQQCRTLIAAACVCGLVSVHAVAVERLDISSATVSRLRLASSFSTESVGAESSAPVYAHGTLFVLTPFPHTLFAIDPANSHLKWRYVADGDHLALGLACCDRSQHGPVIVGQRIFFTTLDGWVVALDTTGAVRWRVLVGDTRAGQTIAGPPVVAGQALYVGLTGDDNGSRGAVVALDIGSGRMLWRRFSAGPDHEVGIGSSFRPFYAADRNKNRGTSTWPAGAWQLGGGGVAGPILSDQSDAVLLHETGHPAPWNPDQRVGENRYTGGLFARDARTGDALWFVAFNDHDPFSYREGADLSLDVGWQGRTRPLLVHADANGFLYVLDRTTGEILGADPFVQSVVAGVDRSSGATRYHSPQLTRVARQTRNVCPAWTGAIGAGIARSPASGFVLLPTSRLCMDIEPRPANYIRGTPYVGANVRLRLPAAAGAVIAWDLQSRRPAWQVEERFPVLGSVLALADLVVYGTLDGHLKALDAHDGRLLWSFELPSGVLSQPVAFRGDDGRPYIAVVAGTARLNGMSRQEALDPRDDSAGFGLGALMAVLPEDKHPAGTVFVFSLP